MKPANKNIVLSNQQAMAILAELDTVVVSLDRIGAHFAQGSQADFNKELAHFVVKWRVAKRLARARAILTERFDRDLGDDDMDDIERALQDQQYWTQPGSSPKAKSRGTRGRKPRA